MTHDVLGGEDAAWLHMEDETNPMVVNGVLELAERLPTERVHALLERVAAIPRFRARVVEPALHAGLPWWEDVTDFDLAHHFEHVTLGSSDDATLRAFVGDAVSELLDRDRPLWRVFVIDRPSRGTTLLYRVHHAIADGFALLGILLSLCDGGGGDGGRRDGGGRARAARPVAPRRSSAATALASVKSLARVVALPADPKTPLKGPLGRQKRVAWSGPLALEDVKRAARSASATVNDVLVATVSGALGRYLAVAGQARPVSLEIRAMVPVDLRGGAPATDLGNRFGLVVLGLPVSIRDPVARVAAVKQRMQLLKGSPEPLVTHAVLRAMGWAPRLLEDLAVRFFGTKASVVLTNVPGPRARLELAGVPVSRVMFWVPQSGRMGIGISILSYAGTVTIGVIVDAGLVPNPDALVAYLHDDFLALQAGLGLAVEVEPVTLPSPQTLAPAERPGAAARGSA